MRKALSVGTTPCSLKPKRRKIRNQQNQLLGVCSANQPEVHLLFSDSQLPQVRCLDSRAQEVQVSLAPNPKVRSSEATPQVAHHYLDNQLRVRVLSTLQVDRLCLVTQVSQRMKTKKRVMGMTTLAIPRTRPQLSKHSLSRKVLLTRSLISMWQSSKL